MIAAEIKTNASTVRIHDEFCVSPTQCCISHLNQIVSQSYKRRAVTTESKDQQPEIPMPQ